MTAMKNGVYALLAVVVGVTLVGLIPGQLSNLAAHNYVMTSLEGSKQVTGNVTLSGEAPSRSGDSANATLEGKMPSPGQVTDTNDGTGHIVTAMPYDPYTDTMYYGMWGVGLITAIGVYFVAKRMLG